MRTNGQEVFSCQVVLPQARRESRLRLRLGRLAGDLAPSLQTSQLPRVPEKWRRRRRVFRGCSSDRLRDWRPRRLRLQTRSADGICARSALAVNTIGNSSEDVLDFASADIGIELIEWPLAAQGAIRRSEPFHGLFLIADHFNRASINTGQANRSVRLCSS